MSKKFVVSGLMATALIAASLTVVGCKKEEKTQEAPAPAQQAPASQQAAAPATVAAYDFESGTGAWMANGKKTVKLEQATDQKHGGNSALKISGTAGNTLWNFAVSPTFNLEAGKKYKLSGWMYVDSWNNDKFRPLLKVSIDKDKKWDSNAFTSKYDLKNIKQWQEVSGTFVAPAGGALTGYIAVEKATKDPITAVVYLDDVKVEAAQ